MKFIPLPLLVVSNLAMIVPTILAQGTFQDVTVTTSIQVSNFPSSEVLNATTSQGEISGVIYFNNCNFASTLLGDLNFPNGTSESAIPLTASLPANNSQWIKFDSPQVPNSGIVALSATSGSNGPNALIPFSFTVASNSNCNARVICAGSLLDYSLTLGGFQCVDDNGVGIVPVYGLCAGLYLGSEGPQLPCQPGSICTYNNKYVSQCLPISS